MHPNGMGRGLGHQNYARSGSIMTDHPPDGDHDQELEILRRQRELVLQAELLLSMENVINRKRQYEHSSYVPETYSNVWPPPPPKRTKNSHPQSLRMTMSQDGVAPHFSNLSQSMPSNYIPSLHISAPVINNSSAPRFPKSMNPRHELRRTNVIQKKTVKMHPNMVLRENQVPDKHVNGRLEEALGSIFKEIRSSNAQNEKFQKLMKMNDVKPLRTLKQAVRERIRSVMLNKPVGSVPAILKIYRRKYSKESDNDLVKLVINSEQLNIDNVNVIETDVPKTTTEANKSKEATPIMPDTMDTEELSTTPKNTTSVQQPSKIMKPTASFSKDTESSETIKQTTSLAKQTETTETIAPTNPSDAEPAASVAPSTPLAKQTASPQTTPVTKTVATPSANDLMYYVKFFGRPKLPPRPIICDFLNKYCPSVIKKHKSVNNLLLIGFVNLEDYNKILTANETVLGDITITIIKANEKVMPGKENKSINEGNDAKKDAEASNEGKNDVTNEDKINEEVKDGENVDQEVKNEENIDEEVKVEYNLDQKVKVEHNVDQEVKVEINVDQEVKVENNVDQEVKVENNVDQEVKVESNVDQEVKVEYNDNGEVTNEHNDNREVNAGSNIDQEVIEVENVNQENVDQTIDMLSCRSELPQQEPQILTSSSAKDISYRVKFIGRPKLPPRPVICDFLNKYSPSSIKKHKSIDNLLVVSFANQDDYNKILPANGIVLGDITITIAKIGENVAPEKENKSINGGNDAKKDAQVGNAVTKNVKERDNIDHGVKARDNNDQEMMEGDNFNQENRDESETLSCQRESVHQEQGVSTMNSDMNKKKNNGQKRLYSKKEARRVFNRLTSGQWKRYNILVRDKVPWDKALEMCQKRWNELPPEANPKRRARMERIAQRIADRLEDPDGIYEEECPYKGKKRYSVVRIQNSMGMTEMQSNILRHAIISKIMQFPKSEGPRFIDYAFRAGTLLVNCRDKQSQRWLQQEVYQCEPWPGAKLSATIVPVTTTPTVLHVLIPTTEAPDAARALTLLKIQNRGLNTEDWTLLSTKSVRGNLGITISVDQRSLLALRDLDYKACLGVKTIKFRKQAKWNR